MDDRVHLLQRLRELARRRRKFAQLDAEDLPPKLQTLWRQHLASFKRKRLSRELFPGLEGVICRGCGVPTAAPVHSKLHMLWATYCRNKKLRANRRHTLDPAWHGIVRRIKRHEAWRALCAVLKIRPDLAAEIGGPEQLRDLVERYGCCWWRPGLPRAYRTLLRYRYMLAERGKFPRVKAPRGIPVWMRRAGIGPPLKRQPIDYERLVIPHTPGVFGARRRSA